MERVQGIGGVFFKNRGDKAALIAWYRDNLGIPVASWGGFNFRWSDMHQAEHASTTWSPFDEDSEYFGRAEQQWMVNFRVTDLHAMLAQLRAAGADVLDKVEEGEYGKFGWVTDPQGNRIELWEPPPGGEPDAD
jgi:predicted enzyme related to lactoylglutathione lyase